MKKIIYILSLALLIFFIKVGAVGYVSDYVASELPTFFEKKDARILFAGDMMFDRTIRIKAEEKSYMYLFSCLQEYMSSFDMVTANLEGAITPYDSLSVGTIPGQPNNTAFTFSPIVADTLYKNNVRMVNLGNNHSWDFGREGAGTTMTYLRDAGVNFFGSPQGSIVATTTINGLRFAFVNFNQFLGMGDESVAVDAIVKVRPLVDYVFVYTHWGDEYAPATEGQKALAREFIDAGADLVIGSHPHVIQEHAMYKGKHIFYSLGNFIFDQYFNDEVKKGGGVEVVVSKQGIEVRDVTFDLLRDGRTCLSQP